MKKSRICLIFLLFYSGLILILPLFEDLTWLNPNESAKGIILNILVIFSVFSLGMYFRLEENQLSTKELTFIAIYSTFTAIIRVPFMGLPNIQPCTYLIFSAGVVFGPLIGFMIGANTALISNIFLGQGPWTIYQIIAWGLVGIIGGFCRIKTEKLQKLWVRILFAFIGILLGLIYGMIMNVWTWLLMPPPLSFTKFLFTLSTSIFFDLLHGVGNFLFMFLFGRETLAILYRYKQRFFIKIVNKDENIKNKEKILN